MLDVLEDHAGFVDEPLLGFQHRHLPARADGPRFGGLVGVERHFFEGQALLQQRQLDHVVVVTDRETIKLEHYKASRPCGVGSIAL
ncbi:hypothetical protein D3C71_2002630 [compost metagenome]